jgi:hypothetical protein
MPIELASRALVCGLLLLGFPGAARANYYDSPRELEVTGPYTQGPSGMVFPDSVAGFQRTAIVSYNSERTDESVDYLLGTPGKKIVVSVYVYPAPADIGAELAKALPKDDLIGALYMLSEQLFADEEQAIVELHSGAQVLDEGETSLDQRGTPYPGYAASFRYREDFFGEVLPVRSQLYLFPMVGGKWMVKYRITYPATIDGGAETEAFIHRLPWTIRGMK